MGPRWQASDLARWLRRRRKRRIARETGESVGMDPDFYDGSDPRDDRIPASGCLIVVIALLVLLFAGAWIVFARGGGDVEIIGSPPTVSSSTPPSTARASTEATTGTVAPPSTKPPTIGDLILTGLLRDLGVEGLDPEAMLELRDLLGDLVDSIAGVGTAYTGPDVDIERLFAVLLGVDTEFQTNGFGNTVYPCGQADPLVVCATDVLEMPAGEMLVVAVQMNADIPTASTERSYIYSIVFDSDSDPANDWVFNPPFDWDYFQGADRWYQAIYDHTTGTWVVDVTQLTADGSFPTAGEASAVRVVISGPWVLWFIPATEFSVYPAPFRVTAFGHDGSFSQSSRGGDVMGADPTEPLVAPPAEPVLVSGD